MLGYILALILAFVLLIVCLAGLGRAARPGRRSGGDKPVGPKDPAADEPTPDRSVTASTGEVAAARGHTPPA